MKVTTILHLISLGITLSNAALHSMQQADVLKTMAADRRAAKDNKAVWYDFLAHLDATGGRASGSIDEKFLFSILQKNLASLTEEQQSQLRNCLLLNMLCFTHLIHMEKNQSVDQKRQLLKMLVPYILISGMVIAAIHRDFISPKTLIYCALTLLPLYHLLKKVLREKIDSTIDLAIEAQNEIKNMITDRIHPLSNVPEGLQRAIAWFEQEGITKGNALDLGCADGRDTLYLLKKGWSVSAVEVNRMAMTTMLQNPQFMEYKNQLNIHLTDYFKLDWASLPPLHLVVALYLTHEANKEKLRKLLHDCIEKIVIGGRFIGIFQCPFSRNEVREEIFKDFAFEMFSFETNEKDDPAPYTCRILAKKQTASQES